MKQMRFPFRKLFCISAIMIFSFSSPILAKPPQEIFHFDRMITITFPEKAPPAIPAYLLPENSEFLLSTDLRTQFYTSIEAFVSLKHSSNKGELERFFMEKMQSREWKLLQSDIKENKSYFVSEGFSRKVITVVISREEDGSSKVKIYYKKNSNF